jgi:hypothetical protein
VGDKWLVAVGAFVVVCAIFCVAQAVLVHRHFQALREQLDNEIAIGQVSFVTLAEIGTHDLDAPTHEALARMPALGRSLPDDPQVTYARNVVVERSTWRWALLHPLGGANPTLYRAVEGLG